MIDKKYDKENAELKITVSAKKEDWKKAQEQALAKLAATIKIDKFRKGKAPLAIAKRHLSPSSIWEEAVEKMLPQLSKLAATKIEKELILDAPLYTVDKVSSEEVEINFIYPVFPEFELKNYKKHGVAFKIAKVTEKDINLTIEKELEKSALLIETHNKVEKNDEVTFDYVGLVNGKEFEGGKVKDSILKIGSGKFIPGFEDKMIGMKKGKGEVRITFPKDYQSAELKGQEAVFKLNIKAIKTREILELNNDFVQTLMPSRKEIKTVADLKKYYQSILIQEKEFQAKEAFKNEVFGKLIKDNKIPIPRITLLKETKKQVEEFKKGLKQNNFTKEQYFKMLNTTEEEFIKGIRQKTKKDLKTSIIFSYLAKQNKIELTDGDYVKEYEKLAKVYGMEVSAVEKVVTKEQIQIPATNDKVIDLLILYAPKTSVKAKVVKKPSAKTSTKVKALKKNNTKIKK